jgi:hypothetical protein
MLVTWTVKLKTPETQEFRAKPRGHANFFCRLTSWYSLGFCPRDSSWSIICSRQDIVGNVLTGSLLMCTLPLPLALELSWWKYKHALREVVREVSHVGLCALRPEWHSEASCFADSGQNNAVKTDKGALAHSSTVILMPPAVTVGSFSFCQDSVVVFRVILKISNDCFPKQYLTGFTL